MPRKPSLYNQFLESATDFAAQQAAKPKAITTRPMGGRTSHTGWQSHKIQRTLSVTNDAWELWTAAAEKAGINRSELFEVLARCSSHMDVEGLREFALGTLNQAPAAPAPAA